MLTRKNKSDIYISVLGKTKIYIKEGVCTMRNFEVVLDFIKEEGRKKAKTKNLYIDTDNKELINYNTVLAKIRGYEGQTKEIEINVNYYSTSTSKIQGYIADLVRYCMNMLNYKYIVVLTGTEKRIKQFEKRIFGE